VLTVNSYARCKLTLLHLWWLTPPHFFSGVQGFLSKTGDRAEHNIPHCISVGASPPLPRFFSLS
jgi:hypothetical protein